MSVERMYRGNHILLITGAGTLGTELVKVVNDLDEGYFGEIRILDHSEEALWRLEEQTHPSRLPLKMFLGDIRDEERMRLAMRNVDTVIHTAALKHLRYTNYNPIECLKSNCEAVYKMIELAIELESVKTFINLSTDKACNPDNIYGETKRIGETLSTWGHRVSGKNIYSVRPGNFFGSHGSVFDRWQEQRRSGEIELHRPGHEPLLHQAEDHCRVHLSLTIWEAPRRSCPRPGDDLLEHGPGRRGLGGLVEGEGQGRRVRPWGEGGRGACLLL